LRANLGPAVQLREPTAVTRFVGTGASPDAVVWPDRNCRRELPLSLQWPALGVAAECYGPPALGLEAGVEDSRRGAFLLSATLKGLDRDRIVL
jgi:hypothetical protein